MPGWLWILIVALILVAVLLFAVTKGREKQRERKRAEADHLRLEAERRVSDAARREAAGRHEAERVKAEREEAERLQREAEVRRARAEKAEQAAREEAQQAKRQRAEAEEIARRAQEVDPEAPDPGEDFDAAEALPRQPVDVRPGGIARDEEVYVIRSREGDERGDDVSGAEGGPPTEPEDGERPGSRRA